MKISFMFVPGFVAFVLALGSTAQADSAPTAPHFRFVPIDTLRGGSFGSDTPPWSPTGTTLALESGNGTMIVYDPTHRGSQHRIPTGVARVHWSPDGRGIAALHHPIAPTALEDSLFVVDVDTGARELVWAGRDAWPFVWASDGFIYLFAERKNLVRVAPAKAWQEHWKAGALYPSLVIGTRWRTIPFGNRTMQVNALTLRRLMPGPTARIDSLPALDSLCATEHVMMYDEFPRQGGFLVLGVMTGTHGYARLVVDDWGRLISPRGIANPAQYPAPGTLSADSYVGFGFDVLKMEDDGSDTGRIADARLTAIDLQGRWKVPIEGAGVGVDPWASREGSFLAYQDPTHDCIVVGKLEISAPR